MNERKSRIEPQLSPDEVDLRIRELQEENESLRLDRDLYSDVYKYAPIGYLSMDESGRILNSNWTAAVMLGMTRTALIGRQFSDMIVENHRPGFERHRRGVFTTRHKQTRELQLRRADGSTFMVRLKSLVTGQQAVCNTALIDITVEKEAEFARLEEQRLRTSEFEKQRIGRELHDDIGSLLKGIDFHLAALRRQLRNGEGLAPNALDQVLEKTRQALKSARQLARGLHSIDERGDAIRFALERLADDARRSGFECALSLPPNEIEFSSREVANHVFRIAQEAVSNVLRHSSGDRLEISLAVNPIGWKLTIRDNGKGLDPSHSSGLGLGLRTMQSRARVLGAKFEIGRVETGGTQVLCASPGADSASPDPEQLNSQ